MAGINIQQMVHRIYHDIETVVIIGKEFSEIIVTKKELETLYTPFNVYKVAPDNKKKEYQDFFYKSLSISFNEGKEEYKINLYDFISFKILIQNNKLNYNIFDLNLFDFFKIISFLLYEPNITKSMLKNQIKKIYESIEEEKEYKIFKENLENLFSISKFNTFVSLTFDNFLEKSIDDWNHICKANNMSMIDSMETKEETDNEIFNIFGNIENKVEFAMTEADILEYLFTLHKKIIEKKPYSIYNKFTERIKNKNLLFVGISFSDDWFFRFLIRILLGDKTIDDRSDERIKAIVDNRLASSHQFNYFIEKLPSSITIHPFTIEYNNLKSNFLQNLLNEWKNEGFPIRKKIEDFPTENRNTKVFISYLREDIELAKRIANTLRHLGFPVFMDVNNLKPGNFYDVEIQDDLFESDIFIPLITDKILTCLDKERYIFKEWTLANRQIARNNSNGLKVLPLISENINPNSIEKRGFFQGVHFHSTDWENINFGKLINDLQK